MGSKRIIVTGCSRGIGLELVKHLASQGHEVLALSRNVDGLKMLAKIHAGLHPLQTEITETEGLDAIEIFVKEFWGEIDILIHNAGILMHKPFKETRLEDFVKVYQVNVFAVAELTRRLEQYFKAGSHVVAISSMGGVQGSLKFAGLSAYSSSKAAIITLMELLAEEYKDKGISFNTLALGAVQTEMLKEAFPDYQAPTTASEMAQYIADFSLNGNKVYNGKVLQVSNSTP
jgi:3-oxoacyl-[acyl-carrier protein] reductase